MGEEEQDLDLATLSDDDLVLQMHDDLYDGLADEIVEGVNILLGREWEPYQVLTKALVEGMRIVGVDFRDGILFVPEVLMAANAMKAGMGILKPLLAETGAPKMGKMLIGTVKGDIHDIGKNLVGMMMEGAGFEVVDLGINNPVENYLEAIATEEPDILGMSALLTTTMPYMKVVIDTMIFRVLLKSLFLIMVKIIMRIIMKRAVSLRVGCGSQKVLMNGLILQMKRKDFYIHSATVTTITSFLGTVSSTLSQQQ